MKFRLHIFLIVIASNSFASNSCDKLFDKSSKSAGKEMNCQCGSELKKLNDKAPPGFHLYAVCNLHTTGKPYPDRVMEQPLDLKKYSVIKHEEIGNGVYYYQGSAILTGILEEGEEINRGSLYFHPSIWNAKYAGKWHKTKPNISEFGIGGNEVEKNSGSRKIECKME